MQLLLANKAMFEITDKFLAILFSLFILSQAYLIRQAVGTYIFPACLLSLAWFFYTFIPLVVLFDVPINPLSVLYINICVLAFSLSSLPFDWARAFKANRRKTFNDHSRFNSDFINKVFYISSISAMIFSTLSVISNRVELYSLIFDLMETSGKYAAMRGSAQGEFRYGVLGVLGIFFTYATAILGGVIYQPQQKSIRKGTILFIALAPSLYYMVTQSQKLVVFLAIGFYCASVLLKKIYLNKLDLFNWLFVLRSIGYAALLLPILSVSFFSREGYSKFDSIKERFSMLFYLLRSYTLGELYAFSDFFSSYLGEESQLPYIHDFHSHGHYTFTSILNFFVGTKDFPPGTYQDGYHYKELFATNIYTIFRGLIYDFGGVGTIFFMFASGLLAHAFFYRLLRYRNSWMACSVFITTVVFIQGTYLVSVFMARYMYLLLVVFIFVFWINNKIAKKQNERMHP